MRKFRIFDFALFALVIFTGLVSGCASTGSYRFSDYSEAPPGSYLLSPAPNFENPGFLARWDSMATEREKIRYLLDRVGRASNAFIRNGDSYDGKMARKWLLYKMIHWVSGVNTAEDFVNRAASHSIKTGKPYLVECSNGKIYTLKSVLRNELFAFENHSARTHVPNPETTLPKPGQVSSLPQAAVARPAA